MFEPAELHTILESAGLQLRAMVLLGINCGFGNADCGQVSKLDLSGGWVNFPRPKTGIPRRCPLWPETTEAPCSSAPVEEDTAGPCGCRPGLPDEARRILAC